jgi:hypothetical protein
LGTVVWPLAVIVQTASPYQFWQLTTTIAKLRPMDTILRPDNDTPDPRPETEAERQARLAREAEGIARARASAAAGRVVSSEAVDAWIDSIGTDHEQPPPRSGR